VGFVKFGDQYRVGHLDIDSQHSQLFDAVNHLHDAMKERKAREELSEVLAFLREYTVFHFETEEKLMQETHYPGFAAHQAIHADLTRKVLELEQKQKEGSLTLSMSVMSFLKDWLTHHIESEDKKLAAHLRAQAR